MVTKLDSIVAVFDLDGTLIDSKGKIVEDVVEAMRRLGYNIKLQEAEGNWYELATKYGISKEKFDEAFDKRKTWEQSLKDGDVKIFSDTYCCLEKLVNGGVRMALLSKSIPEYTDQKIDYFDLSKYFEAVGIVHPEAPSKKNDAIKLIKEMNHRIIKRAYFIGDKEEDVVIADDVEKEFNLNSSGVYVSRDLIIPESIDKYHCVKSLEEIPEIVLGGKK